MGRAMGADSTALEGVRCEWMGEGRLGGRQGGMEVKETRPHCRPAALPYCRTLLPASALPH